MPSKDVVFSTFESFTVFEILQVLDPLVAVPRAAKRKRALLLDFLLKLEPPLWERVAHAAVSSSGSKRRTTGQRDERPSPPKRPRAAVSSAGLPPLSRAALGPEVHEGSLQRFLDGRYLEVPPAETIQACICRFIDCTGNAAVEKVTCMVCARLLFRTDLIPCQPDDLPAQSTLRPTHPHPAQQLYQGMLLHEPALRLPQRFVCAQCNAKLLLFERPPLALANNMWIGEVPFVLAVLTLPERLLIALHFPAAYIVKLFPKKPGRQKWTADSINAGLRGNVSTYHLNTPEIAEMVAGNLMPRPLGLLAAVIGVTFVGAKNIPLFVLPDVFEVRRRRVWDALAWLKANNPLYADIDISEDRLAALPEGGVPEEISLNARYNEDPVVAQREQAGYVPPDVDFGDDGDGDDERDEAEERMDCDVPAARVPLAEDDDEGSDAAAAEFEEAVVPLMAHGSVDVAGDAVTDAELFQHAAENLTGVHRDYAVRRSSRLVNEYPRVEAGQRVDRADGVANHLLGAFPWLFPYGCGGFEVSREQDVSYEAHAKWALRYADHRFRKDLHFVFLVFSVEVRRQVCRSAALQIKRSVFAAYETSFLRLTPADLRQSGEEEARGVPITNPVVRVLRKQLTTVRARVMGTDESRIAIRAQVWGMTLRFNPPSLWITINLSDTGDPLAQVLAGQEIDLDQFVASAGPMSDARAVRIAQDPFAAAEFFHVTIRVILEEVFGIKRTLRGSIERRTGIVGEVNGYIGTVEAQARGTLHLHMLVWLRGAPVASVMRAALTTVEFQRKIKSFIRHNIRAHIDGTDGSTLMAVPREFNIAYCRPEDPRLPGYVDRAAAAERRIARAVQTHECLPHTCLKMKKGRLVCKRRAPWTLADDDWVLPSGEWGPKRLYPRINAWNPPLLQIGRCNHDMKLVTNGADTKDITFYITLYIAKRQIQAANASAILAKGMAIKQRYTRRQQEIKATGKRLLEQCTNTLSRQQEFSAPEVVGYLMGWGDRLLSHTFVRIYWDAMTSALRAYYPALVLSRYSHSYQSNMEVNENGKISHQDLVCRIESTPSGNFVLKDQLKEYQFRGDELEYMGLYDFFSLTYDGKPTAEAAEADDDEEEDDAGRNGPGRPRSTRIPYRDGADRPNRCRIIRSSRAETVLHFIGRWFPRADDPNSEYYSAQMLLLLKPWRELGDLRASFASFNAAFAAFNDQASPRDLRVIENIQYFYECSDRASMRRDVEEQSAMDIGPDLAPDGRPPPVEDMSSIPLPTEEDIRRARDNRIAAREYLYGRDAVSVAKREGIFRDSYDSAALQPVARIASADDMTTYAEWGSRVLAYTRRPDYAAQNGLHVGDEDGGVVDAALVAAADSVGDPGGVIDVTEPDQGPTIGLNREQSRAHDIVVDHMRQTLRGERPRQLLMIIRGEGGTGKTVLLNAISRSFETAGTSQWLAKTATTGVAASLFGGQTLHSWAAIPIRQRAQKSGDQPSTTRKSTVDKRSRNIVPARYLVIDEDSMLTQKILENLSCILGQTKSAAGLCQPSDAFGGINVILFGDLHQFPPVGNIHQALFCDSPDPSVVPSIGLALYQQFETVVTLTEQRRVTDPVWMRLLRRLRTGDCDEEDIALLRTLLVGSEADQLPIDWHQPPWDFAVLVTPRHSARIQWNEESLKKHCAQTGHRVYVCPADDCIRGEDRELTMWERLAVAHMTTGQAGKLTDEVEIAIGMRAMVLLNISTEADLANGTRGEIVDLVLDVREPLPLAESADGTGRLRLRFPPAVVLFRPDQSTFPAFEGLPPGVIPIIPSSTRFNISGRGCKKSTVVRRQFAITPGYAFTDYKSQGQTISPVLIDLQAPPTGALTPFNAYVALSRSHGRDMVRILRGFDTKLFTTHPSDFLRAEDARLDGLTLATRVRFP